MQLSRLELRGFKSFAEKTIVEFSPGMTAIVGPNGSGKSNITDAIRWVLGESNVRNLRGQKAEDVIFSGTETRKAQSVAEVTLLFDNTDQTLPDELGEVAITRRVYRNGDSEFFINKRACRLRDIHRLLADTGLGRDSMAIIGQNKVDAILNSKPEDRRVIFEDVAGISGFKMNKEDAQRRMSGTERNMERVGDLMVNLAEQLVGLKEKAEKTAAYNAYAQEKRILDGALHFRQVEHSERAVQRIEKDNEALQAEGSEIEMALAEKIQLRQQLERDSEAGRARLQALESQCAEGQRALEAYRGERNLLTQQLASTRQTLEDRTERLEEVQRAITAESHRLVLLRKTVQEEAEAIEVESQAQVEAKQAYEAATQAYEAARQAWEASEVQQRERMAARSDISGRREATKREWELLEEQRAVQLAMQEELRTTLGESEEALHQAMEASQRASEEREVLVAERQKLQQQRQHAQESLKEVEQAQMQWRKRQQEAEGRLQILQAWESNHEGYLESTKAIMQGQGPWRAGICGAVGELFTTEETYLTAIDIALGGAVHHLVCETTEDASGAIQYLKQTKRGRATLLPIATVQGKVADTAPLREPGIVGLAKDCLQYDARYEGIFTQLLGRTYVAETLEKAIAVQKQYKQKLRIVTLEGELLQPGGAMTGGTSKRGQGQVMQRKGERAALETQLTALQVEGEQLALAVQEAQTALETAQHALEAQVESLQIKEVALSACAGQEQAAREVYERRMQQWQETETGLAQHASTCARLEATLASIESDWAALEQAERDCEAAGHSLAHVDALQEVQRDKHEAFVKIDLALGHRKQSLQEKRQLILEHEALLTGHEDKRGPLEVECATLQAQLAEQLPAEEARLTQLITAQEAALQEAQAAREEAYRAESDWRAHRDAIEEETETLRQRQQVVQRKLIDMGSRLTKVRLDAETALQALTAIGYSREEGSQLQPPGTVGEWQTKQREVGEAMQALGTINPNAIAEYEEAQERYRFLENQQQDLVTAKEQLEEVIAELDKAMASQFLEVFHVVAERFQEIFAQLFGGGKAQLVLTDRDNILTAGIDMYIQPPGKRLQQLSLLSGGERALTVIALLFAFLGYRPAPFCVLDEVDAPLDEANVERFSSYLHRLCHKTQFIVVTHRKRTMEAAQVLQGVTMVERGISQMLTVSFDEVEEEGI